MDDVPSWIWLAPLARPLLGLLFVLTIGTCHGVIGRNWPTFAEWVAAFTRCCLGRRPRD